MVQRKNLGNAETLTFDRVYEQFYLLVKFSCDNSGFNKSAFSFQFPLKDSLKLMVPLRLHRHYSLHSCTDLSDIYSSVPEEVDVINNGVRDTGTHSFAKICSTMHVLYERHSHPIVSTLIESMSRNGLPIFMSIFAGFPVPKDGIDQFILAILVHNHYFTRTTGSPSGCSLEADG